jgi:1,4-alpha-glucan branching enzyme
MNRRAHLPLLLLLGLTLPAAVWAQSSRGGMGAVPYADASGTGVTFRTWAPNAASLNLRGSFNGWGTTAMAPDPSGGTWSVDVPRARAGDQYKFDINGSWRKDPRGKRVVNSAGNSIVYDPNAFDWAGHSFGGIWRNDLVIYQMHVGTYNAESWLPSTFDQALEKLDHIKSMGFSAVKLMPVNEFPGDRSWGYNPSDPYAIESAVRRPRRPQALCQSLP